MARVGAQADAGSGGGGEQLHHIGAERFYDMRDIRLKQIANLTQNAKRDNPQRNRVYDPYGLAPCLNCCGGGNREPLIVVEDNVQD